MIEIRTALCACVRDPEKLVRQCQQEGILMVSHFFDFATVFCLFTASLVTTGTKDLRANKVPF